MRPLLASVALATFAACAEVPGDYAFGVPIAAAPGAAYQRVALPAAVYEGSALRDLADLRVFNAAGELVPFAFVPRAAPGRERPPAVALQMFPLYVGSDRQSVDNLNLTVVRTSSGTTIAVDTREGANAPGRVLAGYVLDASAHDAPLVALVFALPEKSGASSMRMRVDASDDLATWRLIAGDATLVDLAHDAQRLTKDRIEFPATRAKYLRLSWIPGRAVIEFGAVKGEFGERVVEPEREWRTAAGVPVKDRPREFEYDIGGAFPVDRIAADLPVPNSIVPANISARRAAADAWQPEAATVFYRISQPDGGDVTSPPFPVAGEGRRYWLVRVDPRSGAAGTPIPLRVGWRPQEVVFAARGAGPFTLAFGKFQATPGALPIETLIPDYARTRALPAGVAVGQPGARATLGGVERLQKPPDVMRWALWAALGLGALVLGWMGWRLSRDMSAKPGG